MFIARRPLSIGDHALAIGDTLTQEIIDVLPPGRLVKLRDGGYIDEQEDSTVALIQEAIEGLFERLDSLENQLSTITAGQERKTSARKVTKES